MNARMNFKKTCSAIIMALFFLTTSSGLFGQEMKPDLKDFKIIVEKTEKGIALKSKEGSAWVNLSFSLNNNLPQAVNEYGMTELNNVSEIKDINLADFLFTITTTENEIQLKGIEGTAWTELRFPLAINKKQAINQFGMTSVN